MGTGGYEKLLDLHGAGAPFRGFIHMAIFRNFICCVFLCASVCFAGKGAVIRVHTQNTTPASVDRMLYGRFFEHHGGAVYPGIDEQYIINTSFEKYYKKGEDSPTPRNDINPWLVFRDVKPTEGVAYPWEPFGDTAKVQFSLDSQAFNSQTSQKIVTTSTGGDAGIRQRIALPDYRVDRYPVTLYARTTNGAGEIEVSLKACQGDTVSNRLTFCLSQQWQKFSGILDLKGNRSTTHLNNRQGIYELTISLKGEGAILLDQVTLYPADAVEGRWNPETIAHLKETGVTVIRWPGGNFASSYHWIDGVGPIDKRPTRPNLTWEGLENNHVGTDDFLHFCKLANLTPLICIGFDTCSVQEAADWVEYCNGGVDTTYGKLRAENGHPEPYAVKLWQIGNEVYGDYQIGHTNAKDYATRYLDYYEAIKKADPTIKVMAMGKDPGYQEDDDNAWNKTLFEIIGNKMDYLDIHRYVRGIRRRDELKKWDLTLLSEIYIAFSTQYDKVIDSIAQLREVYDVPDVKLAVTEWAEYLSLGDAQLPHAFSPANAVFYAGMMNSFYTEQSVRQNQLQSRFQRVCLHEKRMEYSRSAPQRNRQNVQRGKGERTSGHRCEMRYVRYSA